MITITIVAVCLFVIGLLFGRRFGVPVLALAAGFVVSQYMGVTVTEASAPYAKQYVSYIPALLIVLPSLVLLLFGKGHHRKLLPRIINAAMYAGVAMVFIIASPLTPVSLTTAFPEITNNVGVILTAGLVAAVLEIAFGKASKKKDDEKHAK